MERETLLLPFIVKMNCILFVDELKLKNGTIIYERVEYFSTNTPAMFISCYSKRNPLSSEAYLP